MTVLELAQQLLALMTDGYQDYQVAVYPYPHHTDNYCEVGEVSAPADDSDLVLLELGGVWDNQFRVFQAVQS